MPLFVDGWSLRRRTFNARHRVRTPAWPLAAGTAIRPTSWRTRAGGEYTRERGDRQPKGHVAIAACSCVLVIVTASVGLAYLNSSSAGATIRRLTELAKNVRARPGIEYAQAQVSTFYAPSVTRTTLVISARLHRVPLSTEAIQLDIADVVLKLSPTIFGEQNLAVNVSYGYDLGIFRWTVARNYVATPEQWLQQLNARGERQPT